jgi:tetratricopeptide (TPR) repeat protein
VELFTADLDGFREAVLAPREKELLGQLEKAPSPVQENRLGVLYAQFGLLTKALERFESAISKNTYIPAMVNAANVYSIQQDYGKAQEYLRRALQQEPDNARALIALAFSLFQSGNESAANNIRAGEQDRPFACLPLPIVRSGCCARRTGTCSPGGQSLGGFQRRLGRVAGLQDCFERPFAAALAWT